MSYTRQSREEYNVHRHNVCKSLGLTQNQYNWFRRKAEKLHKIYEDECNGLHPTEEIYSERAFKLYKEISAKCKPMKLEYFCQTDPRGGTLYLDKKPIPENNYTRAHLIY